MLGLSKSITASLIIAAAAVCLPQICSAEEEAPAQEAPDSNATEDETAQPPEPQPGQVPPLGVWVKPEEKPTELPDIDTPDRPYFFLEDVDEEKVEEVDNAELLQPKRSGFVMLSTRDRNRLERAIDKQRERVLRARAEVREEYWVDPRGEPELRLCSVNTGGYGLRGEVRKLLRGERANARKLLARERSIVKAIVEAKCDVVALQNLVGRDMTKVKEALERLSKKITTQREDAVWESVVADSNSRLLRNAFLVNTTRASIGRSESFTSTLLPRFDVFERPKFAHGPLQLEISVKGIEDPAPKRITLLTMNLAERLSSRKPEPALERMQMAEAIKQIGLIHQQKLNPLDPSMLFLLGDLHGDLRTPESFILEGRRELPDFKTEGNCSLDPENNRRFSCKQKILRPAVFLPLNRESWRADFDYRKGKNEDDEVVYKRLYRLSPAARVKQRNSMIKRTSGIYTVQADIKHVWKLPWTPGDLKSGAVAVNNGVSDSPLVWAELNW